MSWFGLFSYNCTLAPDGLILKDIFSTKKIAWSEIQCVATNFNEERPYGYYVSTLTDSYLVVLSTAFWSLLPFSQIAKANQEFEQALLEKAGLQLVGQHVWIPDMRRWSRPGQPYKNAYFWQKFYDAGFTNSGDPLHREQIIRAGLITFICMAAILVFFSWYIAR